MVRRAAKHFRKSASHLIKPKHPHHILVLSLAAAVLAVSMSIGSVSSGEETVTAAAEETVLSADEEIPFLAAPTTTTTVPPTTTTTAPPPPPPTTVPVKVPPPTTAPIVRTGSCQGWGDLLAAYFPPEQVDKACNVLLCESGGDPTIHNTRSTASGLFQFLDSTWTTVTGQPPPASAYSPEAQIGAAAQLWQTSGWSPWMCA